MTYELTDDDRAIIEATVTGLTPEQRETAVEIHRTLLAKTEPGLAALERTVAMRRYALGLLGAEADR